MQLPKIDPYLIFVYQCLHLLLLCIPLGVAVWFLLYCTVFSPPLANFFYVGIHEHNISITANLLAGVRCINACTRTLVSRSVTRRTHHCEKETAVPFYITKSQGFDTVVAGRYCPDEYCSVRSPFNCGGAEA